MVYHTWEQLNLVLPSAAGETDVGGGRTVVEDVQLDVGLTPGSGLSCTPHKTSMIKLVNRE